MVDKLKVTCKECKVTVKRGKFERHYNRECRIPCPQDCDIKDLTRHTEASHIRDHCPETLVACLHGCGEQIPRKELDRHAAICPRVMVACGDCTARMARCEVSSHDEKCPAKMVPCTHCGVEYKRREIEDHDAVCDAAPVHCSGTHD